MQILTLFLVFYFGASIGSFLNVVIWRLPRQETLGGRSHCPHCHKQLTARELFPLLSFVFLGKKCAGCRQKISWRYFAIESVCGGLFLWAWLVLAPAAGFDVLLVLRAWLVISLMLIIFMVDLEHYIILDSVLIFGALAVCAINIVLASQVGPWWLVRGEFVSGIMAAVLSALPFFVLWFLSGGQWMGFGDVKLALLLGLIFGWPLAAVCLFLGIVLGGVVSAGLLLNKAKTLKSRVPLGTFLSVAAVISLFYGQRLLAWYLALLGF